MAKENIRTFETGATRSPEEDKLDFEGFLSPYALEIYAQYMHKHRKQSDGNLRDSDNWQKKIPFDSYMKSMWRHFFDVWSEHRGKKTVEGMEESLCALIFNAMGYLHEITKTEKDYGRVWPEEIVIQGHEISPCPSGTLIYYKNKSHIPFGWALCDGTNGTLDMRGEYIVKL